MNDLIVKNCKELINRDNLPGLQELFVELKTEHTDSPIDWQYVWLKVYLHSCLKKKHAIEAWLRELYEGFDDIVKIALRQTFPYGRYLLAK